MKNELEILVTELAVKEDVISENVKSLTLANARIVDLEYTLKQLRSQLADIHGDDSILIQIIDKKLNK